MQRILLKLELGLINIELFSKVYFAVIEYSMFCRLENSYEENMINFKLKGSIK